MNILAFIVSCLSFHFNKHLEASFQKCQRKEFFFFLSFWTDDFYLLCAALVSEAHIKRINGSTPVSHMVNVFS